MFAQIPGGADDSSVRDLVRQLGTTSFQQRELAEDRLEQLGVVALPDLRQAMDDSDLEIRYRAGRLVKRIEYDRQWQLLDNFVTHYDPELAQQLAGWTRFAELVGDDIDARQLFVQMYEAEPEIMLATSPSSSALPFVLEKRVVSLRPASNRHPVSEVIPAESTAVLLFASLHPSAQATANTFSLINSLVSESAFRRAATSATDPPIRRLLAGWVSHATDVTPATRMTIGAKFELDAAVDPAMELIESQAHGSQLQYAIFTVARLGDSRHLPTLEKLLTNQTILSERQRGDDEPFRSQVRDVALVALIHLVGKHPREFGFTELRPNSNSLYALNTAGFESDEQRDAAFRKWRLWRKTQQHEGRDPGENAIEGVGL